MRAKTIDERALRRLLRTTCIVLAAGQAWIGRHSMNPDGISYIDIGALYASHRWSEAINAYWSPLYSWLLGFVLAFDPAPRWEFPMVHAMNFLIFLATLASFEWLLSTLMRRQVALTGVMDSPAGRARVWLLVFAYGIFAWSTLWLVSLRLVTPDLLLCAAVFLMATLVLRIAEGNRLPRYFIGLGAVLGAGYLTKSVFLLIALAMLVLLPWSIPVGHKRRMIALTLITFVAVTGPLVAAISWKTGRFTTGESGRLNYLWQVSRLHPPFRHWQGEPSTYGVPLHPTRKVLSEPAVYEFAQPIAGTYAVWLDPSYWFEGAKARVSIRRQVTTVLDGLMTFAAICGPLFVVFGTLLWEPDGPIRALRQLRPFWTLLVIALLGSSIYLLVLVEGRYVAPFVALAGILVGAAKLRHGEGGARTLAAVTCGLLLAWSLSTFSPLLHATYVLSREWVGGQPVAVWPYQQAEQVGRLGLRPGDRIAIIGAGYEAYWARLAKVRVVAEVPTWEEAHFWTAEADEQHQVYDTLARLGVRAVVARAIPATASRAGWSAVDSGQLYVRMLPRIAAVGTTAVEP